MRFLNGLHFNNLRGDLFGGMTAAVVALPLALAMGYASGAGPIAGLYSAIIVGVIAALLGGTPSQVSGPTGVTTVVMTLIFTHYTAMYPSNPELGAGLAFTVVMIAGLFQLLSGVLRLGRFMELIPHPVVSGFISGIGITLILTQLAPLLGLDSVTNSIAALKSVTTLVTTANQAALVMGVLALLIIVLVPRFLPQVNRMLPASMLALVVVSVVSVLLIEDRVPLLGDVPKALPVPVEPVYDPQLLAGMVFMALVLALLASVETLRSSELADHMSQSRHSTNRELAGQGVANVVAGLLGAMPGAGAIDRTRVNLDAGAQTPVSSVFHSLVLLALLFGAGMLAAVVPVAVLSAILIKVGIDMIDWTYIREIRQESTKGVLLMLTVMLMTVFVNLFIAVVIGMVITVIILSHRITREQLAGMHVNNEPDDVLGLSEEEAQSLLATEGRALVFRMHSEIMFGAARPMRNKVAGFNEYDVLILDMTDVPQIDYSACQALDRLVADCIGSGREVMIVGVRSQLGKVLKKQKVLDRIHSDYRFVKLIGAIREAQNFIRQREPGSIY